VVKCARLFAETCVFTVYVEAVSDFRLEIAGFFTLPPNYSLQSSAEKWMAMIALIDQSGFQ
jgi:hypothetical protein